MSTDAYNVGKTYGNELLKLVPKLNKKQASIFGKGFTEVAKAAINDNNVMKQTKMTGSGKRKTQKYMEKMGRVVADDLIENHPHLVGSGFFDDIAKGISSAGSWIGNNVIKPAVNVASKVAEPVADIASLVAPELAVPIQVGKLGVNVASKLTGNGAYGLGQMYGSAILKEHPELRGSGMDNFIEGMKQCSTKIPSKKILSGVATPKHIGKGKASSRALLVKKIMKERGVTLPQASSIIKKENLK